MYGYLTPPPYLLELVFVMGSLAYGVHVMVAKMNVE